MTMNTDNNNRMLMSPPPRHRRRHHSHRKPLGIIQKENDIIIPSSSNDDGDDDDSIKKTHQEMISSPAPKNTSTTTINYAAVLSSPEMKLLPIITTPMKQSVLAAGAVPDLNYNRNSNTPRRTPNNKNIGFRTPNAGKILSPLPLQSRRFKKTPAQKKKIITIDNMDECFHLLCNIDDDQENKNDETNNSAADNGKYYQQLKSKHHLALMINDSDDDDDDDDDVRDDDDDDCSFDNNNNNMIGGSNNVDVKAVHEDIDDDDDESIEWQRSIDDVEFVCKLGEGGTAQVYQVREKDTGTMFALKVQKESDDAMCEMDLHIPLLHPHICRMIDYFYCDTKPFEQQLLMDVQFEPQHQQQQQFAEEEEEDESCTTRYLCSILELCNSGSLHDVIDRFCTMPESIAAQYMKDAIDALEYLHKDEMIIHCDIKPGNWLVTGEGPDTVGTIKLADFGMAVPFNEREIVGGSPVYMSPEHLLAWRDMTDEIDYRSDIYSMGVVLYEMLMGYLPYEVLEANAANDDDEDTDDLLSESESDLSSVVKDNKGNENDDGVESIAEKLIDLSIVEDNVDQHDQDDNNDDDEYGDSGYPVLDLRKLNDITSDKPFYIPPPIFMEDISDEAQDLIMRLMEPSLSKRITLEEAKNHKWFQKVLLSSPPSPSNDVHV